MKSSLYSFLAPLAKHLQPHPSRLAGFESWGAVLLNYPNVVTGLISISFYNVGYLSVFWVLTNVDGIHELYV